MLQKVGILMLFQASEQGRIGPTGSYYVEQESGPIYILQLKFNVLRYL